MTEAGWLGVTDPEQMLSFVRERVSNRKLRLFSVACCEQIMPWNENPRVREALARAERYADGELAHSTMEKWCREINRIDYKHPLSTAPRDTAQSTICTAVYRACLHHQYAGFMYSWEALIKYGSVFGQDFPARGRSIVRLLFDDIVSNPFRPVTLDPSWLTSTVVALVNGIYADRAFDRLPILADALMDAGCDNDDVLTHCRGDGPHVRGCWVVDLLTGRT